MNKKTYALMIGVTLLALWIAIAWLSREDMPDENDFECWGRLHTRLQVDDCQRTSAADIFLSMQSNGKGYLLVNGSWSCQNSAQNVVDGMVNFNFEKEGDYYSITARDKVHALDKILGVLRYASLKVKITNLNSGDYILALPNESLMICTSD